MDMYGYVLWEFILIGTFMGLSWVFGWISCDAYSYGTTHWDTRTSVIKRDWKMPKVDIHRPKRWISHCHV